MRVDPTLDTVGEVLDLVRARISACVLTVRNAAGVQLAMITVATGKHTDMERVCETFTTNPRVPIARGLTELPALLTKLHPGEDLLGTYEVRLL
jgi:hypothetical protein